MYECANLQILYIYTRFSSGVILNLYGDSMRLVPSNNLFALRTSIKHVFRDRLSGCPC